MCGGDNSHCKVVKGTFSRAPKKLGECSSKPPCPGSEAGGCLGLGTWALSGFPHCSGVRVSGLASSDTQPHLAVPRDTWLLGLNLWPTACKLGVASLWGSLPPDDSMSSPVPHCPKVTLRCSRSPWEPDICSFKRLTALTTTWVSLHLLLLPSPGAAASTSHTCK